jgi:hypothetical protein
MEKALKGIEGVDDVLLDKILAMGMICLADVAEVGVEPLVNDLQAAEDLAGRIVEVAATEAKRLAAEAQAEKERKAQLAAAEAAAAADAALQEVEPAEGLEESPEATVSPSGDAPAEEPEHGASGPRDEVSAVETGSTASADRSVDRYLVDEE